MTKTAALLALLAPLLIAACGSTSSDTSDATSPEAVPSSVTPQGTLLPSQEGSATDNSSPSSAAVCDIDTLTDLLPSDVTNISNLTCIGDYAGLAYSTSGDNDGSAIFKWDGSQWQSAKEECSEAAALPEAMQRFCTS